MANGLTVSQLLAAASGVLTSSGYTEAAASPSVGGSSYAPRIFEDAYGIVAVHGFETWRQLVGHWNIAQGQLVDLISTHLRAPEPKAWDGYLVLLTPAPLAPAERVTLNNLRNDIMRVRKLVATGEDLGTLDDVRRALLPLLPLGTEEAFESPVGLLALLPDLLGVEGISHPVTQVVIEAFTANESMLERLHEFRGAL